MSVKTDLTIAEWQAIGDALRGSVKGITDVAMKIGKTMPVAKADAALKLAARVRSLASDLESEALAQHLNHREAPAGPNDPGEDGRVQPTGKGYHDPLPSDPGRVLRPAPGFPTTARKGARA